MTLYMTISGLSKNRTRPDLISRHHLPVTGKTSLLSGISYSSIPLADSF